MHPLTKIFIVIQALLSVLVAALTIPMAVNEDTWKDKYDAANSLQQSATQSLQIKNDEMLELNAAHEQQLLGMRAEKTTLQGQLEGKNTDIADLRSRLANAQQASAEVAARIDTLTATAQTQATIIDNQSQEITRRRDESLKLQRQAIELEDQLRDTTTKLSVALDAQRILQERIAEMERQMSGAPVQVNRGGSNLPPMNAPAGLRGRVLNVQMGAGDTRLAEIDLGSRDGLIDNMKFIIHRDGQFQGNLILTRVDINRSVGRIELEQGSVMSNDMVVAPGG